MKRTWKNMVAVLKAKAENARALADEFARLDNEYDSDEYARARQSYLRDARTLELVIKMIEDKETFDFMASNYGVKEVQ